MKELAFLLPIYKNDTIDYLTLAVESLLNQTYNTFDIIFCVDGPIKDECRDYINTLKDTKQNIIILNNEINRGLSFVLNDGIRYCQEHQYEYVGRMDADDISRETRVEDQLNFLKTNPEIDIVGSNLIFIDQDGNLFNKEVIYPETHKQCRKFFRRRDPVAHPAVMFRKSYFEKAGLYDEKYVRLLNYEDTMMWFQGFKNGCNFANLQKVLLDYRVTDNLFTKRRKGTKRAFILMTDRYKINFTLGFGPVSYLYATALFILTIAPVFIKRFLYKYFY